MCLPHRDLRLEQAPRLGPAATSDLKALAIGGERPIDRRGRDRQQLGSHVGLDCELAVTLEDDGWYHAQGVGEGVGRGIDVLHLT